MATPAEVRNDLIARARLLDRSHIKDHARAMRRGADVISGLLDTIAQLEAAAQAEADRHETYVNGDDLNGR